MKILSVVQIRDVYLYTKSNVNWWRKKGYSLKEGPVRCFINLPIFAFNILCFKVCPSSHAGRFERALFPTCVITCDIKL